MPTDVWAILLAGGDGKRLKPLTRRITGDGRPKQYCALLDGESLLTRTQRRVALNVRPDHHVVVVTQRHSPYYGGLTDVLLPGRLVVQPANRGTAPGILYPVLTIQDLAGDVPVAIFPTDHDVTEERLLAGSVEHALGVVAVVPDRVVLLGIEAEYPEHEYGWIEPGPWPLGLGGEPIFPVARFWEKPSIEQARALYGRQCLWNSFIMVGRVRAFIDLMRLAIPSLVEAMAPLARAIGSWREASVARRVYDSLDGAGFSEAVLARTIARLLVLRVKGVGWTDLGSPARVVASLRRAGRRPPWLDPGELASTA